MPSISIDSVLPLPQSPPQKLNASISLMICCFEGHCFVPCLSKFELSTKPAAIAQVSVQSRGQGKYREIGFGQNGRAGEARGVQAEDGSLELGTGVTIANCEVATSRRLCRLWQCQVNT